jgi:hypothetical protein
MQGPAPQGSRAYLFLVGTARLTPMARPRRSPSLEGGSERAIAGPCMSGGAKTPAAGSRGFNR